ncbi:MAG TPA: Spy/CpxP family protein refolding chaperone [Bryobacteraceae bacterium]|nr:Spy/CpxP family protein refolding chaperone [Bryobacteraceae bacterium]
MRWKKFFLAAGVTGLAVFSYTAAGSSPAAHGPVMPETSPVGLVTSPLHRHMVNVFVLPEMQSELGLSAQQTAELRRLRRDLMTKSKDVAGQIAVRRRELDTLLSGDTSRTRTVKALFDKIADLHAQLQYAGFDTAVRMKAILNTGQKTKFNAMNPAQLHQLMMSRANMTEMQQAMQLMSGSQAPK